MKNPISVGLHLFAVNLARTSVLLKRAACLATACAACSANPQPAAPLVRTTAVAVTPANPCAQARELRALARAWVPQRRFERAIQAIRRADALCPAEQSASWSEQVVALDGMEDLGGLRQLAAGIEAAPNPSSDVVQALRTALSRPHPSRSLLDAWALAAAGNENLDLGVASLERMTGAARRPSSRLKRGSPYNSEGFVWAPNGSRAALLRNGAVHVFDTASWRMLQILDASGRAITDASFTRDGATLIYSTQGSAVELWDIASARVTASWPDAGGFVLDAAHDTLVTGVGKTSLRSWQVPSGTAIAVHAAQPDKIDRVIATGELLVSTGEEGTVRLLERASGATRASFTQADLTSIALSPDGRWLAIGSFDRTKVLRSQNYQGVVHLREARSGKLARTLLVPDPPRYASYAEEIYSVSSLTFSQDSRLLATSNGQGFTCLWDVAQGGLVRTLQRQSPIAGTATGIAMSSHSHDNGESRIGEATRTSAHLHVVPLNLAIHAALIEGGVIGATQDETLAIARLDGTLDSMRYAPAGDRSTGTITPAIDVSPDQSKVLAFSNQELRIWDRKTGSTLHHEPLIDDSIWAVGFSGDGSVLTTQSHDGTVRVLDSTAPESMRIAQGPGNASMKRGGVRATRDGRVLMAVPEDSRTRVIDVRTGREIGAIDVGHRSYSQPLLSDDGSIVAVCSVADGNIGRKTQVWSTARRQKLVELQSSYDPTMAISKDGRWFAAWTPHPGSVFQIWNLQTGAVQVNLPESGQPVFEFSPDGMLLATTRYRNIHLVSTDSGAEVRTLEGDNFGATAIAFDSKGRTLAVGFKDGVVREYEVASGIRLRSSTIPGASINALAFSSRDVLAVATTLGQVQLLRGGDRLATVHIQPSARSGVVTAESGAMELVGDRHIAAQSLVCRVGVWSLPWEACEVRFEREGVLNKALRGQVLALDQ
ncbi:MAG: WD40 repeat domain-containing protein [Deltaproteobacteria bacterium]|nr:WD40 repeat domain-containing protein [Deltaproteobacteria bacterium]